MTNNNHPITPPPELVEQWYEAIDNSSTSWKQELATQAARWGADMELETCCQWLSIEGYDLVAAKFRAARRPEPSSLKEQALEALKHTEEGWRPVPADCAIIRRALESLPD